MSIYFIAEIGINHNGNLEIAKKLETPPKYQVSMQLNFKKNYRSCLFKRNS